MATLKNHPGFWMRDDAAASLARWEADHGIIGVNSAGRTVAEQQHLINRWNQGGTYNRPPYLYEPKRPASASSHVANGGIAFDTSEYVRFRRTSADYGWWQPYDWDVVHFEYSPSRDKRRGGSTPHPTPKPKPTHDPLEDDMATIIVQRKNPDLAKGRMVGKGKIEMITRHENTVFRAAQQENRDAVIYVTVSDATFTALQKGAK